MQSVPFILGQKRYNDLSSNGHQAGLVVPQFQQILDQDSLPSSGFQASYTGLHSGIDDASRALDPVSLLSPLTEEQVINPAPDLVSFWDTDVFRASAEYWPPSEATQVPLPMATCALGNTPWTTESAGGSHFGSAGSSPCNMADFPPQGSFDRTLALEDQVQPHIW